MLILFVKSQLALFDAPIQIAAHVRKDGTVVKPHIRIQKVAIKQPSLFGGHHEAPAPTARPRGKLHTFLARHGGPAGMAAKISAFNEQQQAALIEQMAKVGGVEVAEVRKLLGVGEAAAKLEPVEPAPSVAEKPAEEAPVAEPEPAAEASPAGAEPAPAEPAPAEHPDLVEHVTGKGKTLRGVVRADIDGHAAAAIDPYTFRKNGGWFIREKHLGGAVVAAQPVDQADPAEVAETQARAVAAAAVDKSKAQAAKLREAGEKLLADSEAEYGRDRNANTARRARMAASAEASAAEQIRIAKTMINLASAIEDGDARYLAGVSTKAAVVSLEAEVKRSIMETDRKLTYVEQERNRGRSVTDDDLANAKFPAPKWGTAGTSLSEVLDAIKGKRGAPALAAKLRASAGPTPETAVELRKLVGLEKFKSLMGWWNIERLADMNRLQKLGITDNESLRNALAEFVQHRGGHKPVDPIKAAERALVGKKVGVDFFPTPKTLAAAMAQSAGIGAGMRVLEPSAGNGHLADAAKAAGADVDTVEISDTLRNILQAKGHNLAGWDFETFEPAVKYDAVLMNPPFSDRKDAAHIMRAMDMLKPGGKLVAIAGEGVFFGSDKKAVAFREWLAEHGAEVEQLPAGTFMGADLPAQTGANARLIKITKAAEVAAAEPRMKNYGWDRVKLADAYSLPDLEKLRQQVMAEHANPKDEGGHPLENGQSTIHMYDKAGRKKLENLSWAVTYKLREKQLAGGGSAEAVGESGPKDGDRDADGLVFRDGRWHRDGEEAKSTASAPAQAEPVEPPAAEPAPEPASPALTDADLAEDREDLATELTRNPHSVKSKAMLAAAAERHARAETPSDDADDPSSPNYRFADTGHIAGSRKEEAAANVIQRAKRDGAQVLVQNIDWEGLEQNPREAKDLITKSNLFGSVAWDHLRENGMEPGAGFLVDRIYAAIGQEPGEDNAQARRDYTLGLQTLRTRLETCKTSQQVVDVLEDLRREFDGKVLNAEESAAYQKASDAMAPLYKRMSEIDDETKAHRTRHYAEIKEHSALTEQQDKRIRRGWKPDAEIAARISELRDAAEQSKQEWIEGQTARNTEERALREQVGAVSSVRRRIEQMAFARNKIENPLHRAWSIMGERFVGVLRYRSYKGSEAFQKHVTAAKNGLIKDWAWVEKEGATKAPRVRKESARFQMRVADRYERKGGRAVAVESTLALKSQFGLRDVQSGNWVLRDPVSAKFHTEQCAAAFADLADLIGIPDEQVSFNGRLAVAFGARGKGNAGFGGAAAAHYEPVHRVINMTKMSGGGALAHEWFHAVDNMIKEAEGAGGSSVDDWLTEQPDLLPAGPLRDAFIGLRDAMITGEHQVKHKHQYTAEDYKLAQHNLNGAYMGVGAMVKGAADAGAALDALDAHFSRSMGRRGAAKNLAAWRRIAIAWHGGNPDGGEVVAKSGPKMSAFRLGAHELDAGSKQPYYTQVKEMAARAFQSWVEDRMEGMGRKNDYLSCYADNKYHVDPLFGNQWKPFPEGDERERINVAFDRLMAAIGENKTLAKALAYLDAA